MRGGRRVRARALRDVWSGARTVLRFDDSLPEWIAVRGGTAVLEFAMRRMRKRRRALLRRNRLRFASSVRRRGVPSMRRHECAVLRGLAVVRRGQHVSWRMVRNGRAASAVPRVCLGLGMRRRSHVRPRVSGRSVHAAMRDGCRLRAGPMRSDRGRVPAELRAHERRCVPALRRGVRADGHERSVCAFVHCGARAERACVRSIAGVRSVHG